MTLALATIALAKTPGATHMVAGTEDMKRVHVVDLDGDGDSDLVGFTPTGNSKDFGVAVLLHGKPGRFERVDLPKVSGPDEVLGYGDMDADGDMDIVVATSGELHWFPNEGGARTWGSPVVVPGASESRLHQLVVADFDGDGDGDIVAFDKDGNATPQLLSNDGTGAVFTSTALPQVGPGNRYLGSPVAEDFDGDGDIDLAHVFNGGVAIQVNNGGSWEVREVWSGNCPDRFGALRGRDVDGDGDVDLAAIGEGGAEFLENTGALTFAPVASATTVKNPSFVALGDLSGDGQADLAVSTYSSPSGTLGWLEASSGAFVDHPLQGEDVLVQTSTGVRAVDMDQDGDLDLLLCPRGKAFLGLVWIETD
jgi:hypothetical protein